MKHRIISKIADFNPYEIIQIELLADTDQERNLICGYSELIENYLTFNLEAVEILEQNPPNYIIKKVKSNIGIGR